MISEPLSLHHKSILAEPLRALGAPVSEYSFANLYLFRKKHEYSVLTGDELFITGKTYNGYAYAMPTRDMRLIMPEVLNVMIKTQGMLFPVLDEWLPLFNTNDFNISYDDAESDYLHEIGKLATYSGNRLHSKKNLLNQFKGRYDCRALPLTNDRLADAQRVLDAWQKESALTRDESDYAACSEALLLYEELVLCGCIYYIEDEPAGFIIGEELGGSIFVLHFVKAKRAFRGIYQFMYNQFAQIMPAKYGAFNFEQDLGIESLRQSKASYRPEKMIKKYRVSRIRP